MSFEEYEAEASLLMSEVQDKQSDMHEAFSRLQQIIATMRAEGLPVPENLKQFEKDLDNQFRKDAKS